MNMETRPGTEEAKESGTFTISSEQKLPYAETARRSRRRSNYRVSLYGGRRDLYETPTRPIMTRQ
ncbi:hypothetical protein E2C01_060790 [Portunus trituberculatus]|uniref:Uncharacterized protein n=1 Tax=Portunus trituberculatus TaxID=210409 RepID=A0A5B7H3J0_PORTR|nr:hypothetical protein [Portunus trituberculatus]